MIVIANVFPQLKTLKILVGPLSETRRFRTCFVSQHMKASKILEKPPLQQTHHDFPTFTENLVWKMSPLVIGEILEVFVNTLTGNAKYSNQDCDNLPLPIQMQLSEKQKTFSQLFVPFLESTSNFKLLEKKDNRHSLCFSQITDCEKLE